MLIYVGHVRPRAIRREANLDLFNEVMLMIVIDHLPLNSLFVPDSETRYKFGWSLIASVII